MLTFSRSRKVQATLRTPGLHIRNHCCIRGTYAFTSSCLFTQTSSTFEAGLAFARLRFVESVPRAFPGSGSMVSSGCNEISINLLHCTSKCVPSSVQRASQQRPRLVLLLQELLASFLAAFPAWKLELVNHWFSALQPFAVCCKIKLRNNITKLRVGIRLIT